jgi:exosortase family protein XrtG
MIMIYFSGNEIEIILKKTISYIMFYLTLYLDDVTVLKEYFLINIILKNGGAMSWIMDYECTGIVEILVYYSLLLFYPIRESWFKIKFFLIGTIYLIFANVIRLFVILCAVLMFGENVFYFAHIVLGRIVFFILVIILYYNVFTKKHIKQQIVGDLYDA